ncbi:MAG: GNAT family N-acetyltransferase [Candidatus Zixiibacteriota bacterium]
MLEIRSYSGYDECKRLWNAVVPQTSIWDLWDVRECFDRNYNRQRLFIAAEEDGRVRGLLPLSWIEEDQTYGYFPGETWDGKTWIEQNRIYAENESILEALFAGCPGSYHLRYLNSIDTLHEWQMDVDEVGYLFLPPQHDFKIENYYSQFSSKSFRRISQTISDLEAKGAQFRYDNLSDVDVLMSMNLNRFEERSYFHDIRFRESFREMVALLHERGWLRITTVVIDEKPAAVDVGCIFNGAYVLVAGGTDADYPGVAKLINMHHMQWACRQRFEQVDFLCGEFSWKPMFHLSPRPLYALCGTAPIQVSKRAETRKVGYAG